MLRTTSEIALLRITSVQRRTVISVVNKRFHDKEHWSCFCPCVLATFVVSDVCRCIDVCVYVCAVLPCTKATHEKRKRREEKARWMELSLSPVSARSLATLLFDGVEQARVSFLMSCYRNSIWFDTILLFFRSDAFELPWRFRFQSRNSAPPGRTVMSSSVNFNSRSNDISDDYCILHSVSFFIHSTVRQVSPTSNSAPMIIACRLFNKNNIIRLCPKNREVNNTDHSCANCYLPARQSAVLVLQR